MLLEIEKATIQATEKKKSQKHKAFRTIERNPDTFYPDPYKGIELLSPYIRAVSAKSEDFNKDGEETSLSYQRMFEVLKKAPQLEFAGVEYFGNGIPRSEGVVKTKALIEKAIQR